jgi:hypothetical protein
MAKLQTRRRVKTRRTEHDIIEIEEAIVGLLTLDRPMTCRQVFYRLVSQGVIGKSESEYQSTVVRLLSRMRRAGKLPFAWIADNTRLQRKPTSYLYLEDALQRIAKTYRRNLWDDVDCYVEVWCEKDALSGVLYSVTSKWDVPLMICRGYPSLSFLHAAATTIEAQRKPAFLYYLGDHDPSGVDISRFVEQEIREIAPGVDLMFDRVAVNPDQIKSMGLLTRPTKKSDTRSKNFEGESVEVDAIVPSVLRELVDSCISQHVSKRELAEHQDAENDDRETLAKLASKWPYVLDGDDDDN